VDSLVKSDSPTSYLLKMEWFKLRPTFWTSEAYLTCVSGLTSFRFQNSNWLEAEGGICLFPPITDQGKYDLSIPTWAIPSDQPNEDFHFLDWEYIYHPENFLNLSGNKWEVFRKNSRKWAKVHPYWSYSSLKDWGKSSESVLIKWLENRPDDEIHDNEVMLKYLSQGNGQIFGLYEKDRLVGFNCWDSNYRWTNFRYSFADPEEPWLSEFLRLLFYQSQMQVQEVNDGGVLDNPNLERFKDKLHPAEKNKVYSSWENLLPC